MSHANTTVPDAVREAFLLSGDVAGVMSGRSEAVEDIVRSAYHDLLYPYFPEGLAVLAVGGFGRRELFPHSDVDVLLLAEKEQFRQQARDALSAFLRALWDAGLRLSHSVRTRRECCELHDQNIELNISLLDQRFLAGDRQLYDDLAGRLPRFLHGQRQNLVRHLCRLTRARHSKAQDTIYHLEPNVKETPGGLRDIHMLWWLEKLRGEPAAETERMAELESARLFLSSLRCFLHFRAGRDDNLLSFDAQDEIADQPFFALQEPENWMRAYFRHARNIHRLVTRAMDAGEAQTSLLLREFRNWRSRLSNAEFTVSRERVFFKAPQRIRQDPQLTLRLFAFVGRHGLRLALDSERRIAESLPALERYFSQPPPLWPALREIFSQPYASRALAAMHETGVLGAIFPEWARIECLVVRDFYHRYTVDEHTLIAIQCLEELRATTDPARLRFADLLGEVEEPALLAMALLLHDVGKGEGNARHCQRSAELAEQAMDRVHMPDQAQKMVCFLIQRHLDLSAAISGRDLDDPSTAVFLAEKLGTLERLKYLTLLTYADISAVNPTAMSSWRLEQLWRVYLASYLELTKELETERIEVSRSDSPQKAAFLDGFPTRYLRTHSEQEIDAHLELEQRSHRTGVALEIARQDGVYRLTLVTKDRPFLLASIAGALASFGLNILKSEAFSNRTGTILDTFVFEDPARTLDLNPSEMERLQAIVERVASGRLAVKELLRNRPKPSPPSKRASIQPRVSFNSEASASATLIEIVAQDRPGLLYELAGAISEAGCNIEVVLIDTEAHKALDVFYVTASGKKLAPDREESLQQSLLEVVRQ